MHQISLLDFLDVCVIRVTKSTMDITCNTIIGLAICGYAIIN